MLELADFTGIGGLLAQSTFCASSGGGFFDAALNTEKLNAYTPQESFYFISGGNNNNNNNNNNNGNNNGDDNIIIGNAGSSKSSASLVESPLLNSSFNFGANLVDGQWSLEDFLLGGAEKQQQQHDELYDFLSPSPQTPPVASPQSLASSPSNSSSLDDILDDLEILSPQGSPQSNQGLLGSSPSSSLGSPYSPPFAASPYASSSSSSSVGSPAGLGSPAGSYSPSGYGSGLDSPSGSTSPSGCASPGLDSPYSSSVPSVEIDPLEELLNDLSSSPSAEKNVEAEGGDVVMDTNTLRSSGCYPQTVTIDNATLMQLLLSAQNNNNNNNSNNNISNSSSNNNSNNNSSSNNNNNNNSSSNNNNSIRNSNNSSSINNSYSGDIIQQQNIGVSQNQVFKQETTAVHSPITPLASPPPSTPGSPAEGSGSKVGRRYTPYNAKPRTEAQKERKKEHNRKSATKYRSKKKQELSEKTTELDQLEERNTKLKGSVEELRKEIDYLKTLMLDVIKARVVNNKQAKKTNDVDVLALLAGISSST